MVAIDGVLMCCCGLFSAGVMLHSFIFKLMVLSSIEGRFHASIDWFNTGDLGDWFVDVSLGKYFVIGFCCSVTCFLLLSLINFFATFIHARMDCSVMQANDSMSRPNHLFSG